MPAFAAHLARTQPAMGRHEPALKQDLSRFQECINLERGFLGSLAPESKALALSHFDLLRSLSEHPAARLCLCTNEVSGALRHALMSPESLVGAGATTWSVQTAACAVVRNLCTVPEQRTKLLDAGLGPAVSKAAARMLCSAGAGALASELEGAREPGEHARSATAGGAVLASARAAKPAVPSSIAALPAVGGAGEAAVIRSSDSAGEDGTCTSSSGGGCTDASAFASASASADSVFCALSALFGLVAGLGADASGSLSAAATGCSESVKWQLEVACIAASAIRACPSDPRIAWAACGIIAKSAAAPGLLEALAERATIRALTLALRVHASDGRVVAAACGALARLASLPANRLAMREVKDCSGLLELLTAAVPLHSPESAAGRQLQAARAALSP